MFRLDTDGTTILMHRGNTGTITISLTGYTFGANDRVLFRMMDRSGNIVKQKICEIVNNSIEIEFVNEDTDRLQTGDYYYGITAATDPVYESGEIVDGTDISTPENLNDKKIRIYNTTALI